MGFPWKMSDVEVKPQTQRSGEKGYGEMK